MVCVDDVNQVVNKFKTWHTLSLLQRAALVALTCTNSRATLTSWDFGLGDHAHRRANRRAAPTISQTHLDNTTRSHNLHTQPITTQTHRHNQQQHNTTSTQHNN